ncbi:hypothetical protein DVH24_034016 [Malus domestica]|uniref:Uncharacterized protein n=1 Tax=Malus domestica TaxID=3750 RepID=A0A498KMM4_MALDO|nr:hypothetical protein DVH24_034016 [Malus domestica]
MAFKQCEDEDDALKMGLVYFAEGVLIGAKSTVSVNLEYLDLVKDMDRVPYRSNNYKTTFVLLLLGEEDEEGMVIRKEMRRMRKIKRNNRGKIRGGIDSDGATKGLVMPFRVNNADVVMPKTLTPDTNDVGQLKAQIRELKVTVGCLAHKKDIFQRNVLKKVEELMEEVNVKKKKKKKM